MTKKIVVQVPLDNEENRREAMKLSVQVVGVTSVALDKDKGQITVTGEGIDPVALAKALKGRKLFLGCLWPYNNGVRPVNLVAVEDVKPEEKKPEEKKDEKKPTAQYPYCYGMPPVYQVVERQGSCWW